VKTALASILLLVLASCNFSSIKVDKSFCYAPASREPRLAICVKGGTKGIRYEGDVENEFGAGPKEKLIFNYFAQSVLRTTAQKTVFKHAEFNCESMVVQWDTIFIKGMALHETAKVCLPRDGASIEFLKSGPDFVLWISDLSVSKEFSSGAAPHLKLHSVFVLWDPVAKKSVSYGYIEVSDRAWAVTKENWDRIVEMYVDKLFSKTPYFVAGH
jgi:hypothetical protein